MNFHFFFALCLVAVFVVAINAEAEDTSDVADVGEVESRTVHGKAVAKIIGKIAAGMTANCVFAAAEHCSQHWKSPGEAVNCAKTFFKANKGWCAVNGK